MNVAEKENEKMYHLVYCLTQLSWCCRALDCILEPGKRVVEVGSGLGYWAYLLKMRSGDDSRVRCFDPFAPEVRNPPSTIMSEVKGRPQPLCFGRKSPHLIIAPEAKRRLQAHGLMT